jgi:hypothetical protein
MLFFRAVCPADRRAELDALLGAAVEKHVVPIPHFGRTFLHAVFKMPKDEDDIAMSFEGLPSGKLMALSEASYLICLEQLRSWN